MVISCSTCQKEESFCICVTYVIYAVKPPFKFSRNLRTFFCQIIIPRFSGQTKQNYSDFLSKFFNVSICFAFIQAIRKLILNGQQGLTAKLDNQTSFKALLKKEKEKVARLLANPFHVNLTPCKIHQFAKPKIYLAINSRVM